MNRDSRMVFRYSSLTALFGALMLMLPCPALMVGAFAADQDSDGMSEDYEVFFGLDDNDADDGKADNDSDELLNAEEFILWTDPFAPDTDHDGWSDNTDFNPISRAYIDFGNEFFTYSNHYEYAAPPWLVAVYKNGGEWSRDPDAWHVPAKSEDECNFINIEFDRQLLTNNLVLELSCANNSGASLRADLYDARSMVIAGDIFGNLCGGNGELRRSVQTVPLRLYPAAVGLRLRRDSGEVAIYEALLYVDQDGDGLDPDQEAQLGTSDLDRDSDGDGVCDFLENSMHDPAKGNTNACWTWMNGAEPQISPEGCHLKKPLLNVGMCRIIYVSKKTGNDAFDGKALSVLGGKGPKKTVAAGLALARNADTLVVTDGSYPERLNAPGKKLSIKIQGSVSLLGNKRAKIQRIRELMASMDEQTHGGIEQ